MAKTNTNHLKILIAYFSNYIEMSQAEIEFLQKRMVGKTINQRSQILRYKEQQN